MVTLRGHGGEINLAGTPSVGNSAGLLIPALDPRRRSDRARRGSEPVDQLLHERVVGGGEGELPELAGVDPLELLAANGAGLAFEASAEERVQADAREGVV